MLCTRVRAPARTRITYNNIIRVSGTRPSSTFIRRRSRQSARTNTRPRRRLVFVRARARDGETRPSEICFGIKEYCVCGNDNSDSNNNEKKKSCVRVRIPALGTTGFLRWVGGWMGGGLAATGPAGRQQLFRPRRPSAAGACVQLARCSAPLRTHNIIL